MKKTIVFLTSLITMVGISANYTNADEIKNWDYYKNLSDAEVVEEFSEYTDENNVFSEDTEYLTENFGSYVSGLNALFSYDYAAMGIHFEFPSLKGEKITKLKSYDSSYYGFPTEIILPDGEKVEYDFSDSDLDFDIDELNGNSNLKYGEGNIEFKTDFLLNGSETKNGVNLLRIMLTVYHSEFYEEYGENGTVSRIIEPVDYEFLKGDTDLDGIVTINDAVKIMSYVTNQYKYPISRKGIEISDIYATGDGINNMDALEIQKYLANII